MPRIHQLHTVQVLPTSMEEAWEFFSDPANLDAITPPDLGFETVSGAGEKMFAGQIIVHRIKILPLVRLRWVTEITHVDHGRMFVDEQRFGPYKFWHHRHQFEPDPESGGVRMADTVHYALGFWLAGEVAHKVFVGRKLKSIFAHRRDILAAHFNRT